MILFSDGKTLLEIFFNLHKNICHNLFFMRTNFTNLVFTQLKWRIKPKFFFFINVFYDLTFIHRKQFLKKTTHF